MRKRTTKLRLFLKNWKDKRNNKTNSNNKCNKQNDGKKRITYYLGSSNESKCSSSISEVSDHNPSNNNSVKSSATMVTNDSNSISSSITTSSPVVTPKWQPRTLNNSRINLYTQTNQTRKILTVDRTITPKRKILTPTKPRLLTTKQDDLTAFGFRAKIATPSPKNQQPQLSNTLQTPIQKIEPFATNEFKGDRMNKHDPNHIRIFYMNINGLKLGQGGHSLLQLLSLIHI